MILWGMSSDSSMERIGHLSIALAIAAIGIGASAALNDPLLKMVALTLGAFGVFASLPIFWTLPTAILSGATAAAGIAAINSIGNLSGYFGPFVIGWIKDATGIVRLGPGGGRRLRRGGDGDRPRSRPRPRAGEGARQSARRLRAERNATRIEPRPPRGAAH